MSDNATFKSIAKKRLATVKLLMDASDWEMAVYMMGYTLECALKAKICKTLNLSKYPEDGDSDAKIRSFFMTHSFERLLLVSGMESIFSDRGNPDAWYHWSQFTPIYQGEWTAMRYDSGKWDEASAKSLYTHLTTPDHGIMREIRKRW